MRDRQTFGDAFTSPEMTDIRDTMLRGEEVPGCRKCYLQEAVGKRSLRQVANDSFGRPIDPELQSLELALGNLCNNACIICHSAFSTRWVADEISLGRNPVKHQQPSIEHLISGIELDRIEHLKLIGGEPLLYQDQIVSILERMPALRIVDLTTNGTLHLKPKLAQRLLGVEIVNFTVSIDAIGRRNEYIRYGSVWTETETAFRNYIEQLGIDALKVHTVAQVANASYLFEIEQWLDDKKIQRWEVDTLVQPECFDIRNLSQEAKAFVADRLMLLRNKQIAETISAFMMSGPPSPTEFWSFTNRLDALRNQNFSAVFPEIAAHMR